jgi:hypothetical protein
MDRLLTMDKEQFISQMQGEIREVLSRVADAVNGAPTGNVINGSEIAVRDAIAAFRERAFEKAVQMRIDSTESSFFPSAGCNGQTQAEQRALVADHVECQRADRASSYALLRPRRGKRQSGGSAG